MGQPTHSQNPVFISDFYLHTAMMLKVPLAALPTPLSATQITSWPTASRSALTWTLRPASRTFPVESYQWMLGLGWPLAAHLRVTLDPSGTSTGSELGYFTIRGRSEHLKNKIYLCMHSECSVFNLFSIPRTMSLCWTCWTYPW